MFRFYDHLGFMMPYYTISSNGKFKINQTFTESVSNFDDLKIDIHGVIQILSHYHCFGDRTLIKGLRRTPWLAKPSEDLNSWEYAEIPPHKNLKKPAFEIVQTLKNHLENELLVFLEGKKKVGVLLSGGMDSRVLAAMLSMVKEKHQLPLTIVGLTWGISESRDVKYGQKIARKLNWDWKYFNLGPENLIEDIEVTAAHGCEFSPLHLHAMPNVREYAKNEDLDCILAASFGDSIGRAEYSGNHVTQLKPVERYVRNWFKLINPDLYKDFSRNAQADARGYRQKYPHGTKLEELEIEKQSQYMRRQLNPCMGVINEVVPVYQLFSAPKTYEFMWSLDPTIRNNQLYEILLKDIMSNLLEIPWARTGKKYLTNEGNPDLFTKDHSFYGDWIRNDLKQITYDKIFSSGLNSLNIFNMEIVEQLWQTNQKYFKNKRHSKVEEIILWLSSLGVMTDEFNIKSEYKDRSKRSRTFVLNKVSSKIELVMYKSILSFKNIK